MGNFKSKPTSPEHPNVNNQPSIKEAHAMIGAREPMLGKLFPVDDKGKSEENDKFKNNKWDTKR
jgi:hypothetical protein